MVPPRAVKRATTTAARILSTILLCAGLRIALLPQSIPQFQVSFSTPAKLFPAIPHFLPYTDHFFPPPKSVIPLRNHIHTHFDSIKTPEFAGVKTSASCSSAPSPPPPSGVP